MTPEELEAIRIELDHGARGIWGISLYRAAEKLYGEVERLQRELGPALAVLEAARVWRSQFYKPTHGPRMAALIAAVDAVPCCDMHNVHCEPPSELCCRWCTEAEHPVHRAGAPCVLDQAAAAPSPSNTQEETAGD